MQRRRCGLEEWAPTSKTIQMTISHLDRTRSQVGIRWRRRSGCEMKRLELENGLLLKLLGSRKSRSPRNGTNTKTVLRSICKPRGGRSARKTISLIPECEERKRLLQRLLRTIFGMLPRQLHNTATTILHEDRQLDRKRVEEPRIPLAEISRVEVHQQPMHISSRRLHLLQLESRVCKHIFQHHPLLRSLHAQSQCPADRKLKITLDTRRFLPYLERQLSSPGTEDVIEAVAD